MNLDFSKNSVFPNMKKSQKVRCKNTCVIQPNTESVLEGKLGTDVPVGTQGVCLGHSEMSHKGLLVAKGLVTCLSDHIVPVRIWNPSNEIVHVNKGSILCTFSICDNSVDVHCISPPKCAHVQLQSSNATLSDRNISVDAKQARSVGSSRDGVSQGDFCKFSSYFEGSISSVLSDDQRQDLLQCLYKHKNVFVTDENPNLGFTTEVEHTITLKPNAVSKHQRPYRLPPDKRLILRHHLDELQRQNIIAPVSDKESVPITSPIVLVSKRNKPKLDPSNITREQSLSSFRFCVDFRYLNTQTEDFRYNIPDLQELAESFAERTPNFITSVDLSQGFFQVGISSDSTRYTAFNTPYGTYKFLRLPMGLRQSPNFFQFLMDRILKKLTFEKVLCYLDDLCIVSDTFENHLRDLHEILQRLENSHLKLGPNKCSFAQQRCVFLGHEISKDGIRPPAQKLEIIKNYMPPRNAKELKCALGLFIWFRKFIPNYSAVASPLYYLLKKNVPFKWTQEHEKSFQELKDLLVNSEALAYPRYDLEFRLAVDTCSKGIGYMIYQIHPDGTSRVVRFGSKGLSKWQQSYGPTKLELLGLVTSVLDCSSYLRGRHFTVECDHQALRPLFQKQLKGQIYERWMAILQQFDFDIVYKPAAQMTVPDALSRNIEYPECMDSSPEEEDPYFPYVDEKPTQIRVMTPNHTMEKLFPEVNLVHAQQFQTHPYDANTEDNFRLNQPVKRLKSRRQYREKLSLKERQLDLAENSVKTVVPLTQSHCSEAEHSGDDHCSEAEQQPLCCSPSEHDILDRCSGSEQGFSSNNDKLNYEKCETVKQSSLSSGQEDITQIFVQPEPEHITPVTISTNDRADNLSSQIQPDDTLVDTVISSSERSDSVITDFQSSTEEVSKALQELDMSPDSMSRCQGLDSDLRPFIDFLSDGTLPKSQKRARSVLLQQSDYALINGVLFHSRVAKLKRVKLLAQYQLALPKSLIPTVLKLFHDSTFAAHGGIHDTIDKIQEHYYFLKLSAIVNDYVKSCPDCQRRKVTRVQTKNAITAYPTPSRPFSVWQIDLYGPIPVTTRGYSYIFTAVDMFSKFLYTKPLHNKDAMSVSEVLFDMFATFGVCDTLISDQGSEFTARVTRELCSLLQIPQQFSLSFVHHTLGACERTHRTLATRLTPYMNKRGTNWDQYLSAVVFAMNSAVNASTGYSPFEVIFGERPKFPLTSHSNDLLSMPVSIRDYLKQKLAHVNAIQQQVKANVEKSKQVMLDRANENSAVLKLSEGDYVYLTKETTGPAQKLHDLYDGPYVVKSVPSPHTVVLHDPENKRKFPRPLHLTRMKVAYVRQPTPSNYFSVVTRAPEVVFSSTGTQTFNQDIYTQETEIDSVERSELSSQEIISNEEKREDTHSSKSSSERIFSEIETQSQTPNPLKSVEIETHEKTPSVIQEPVLRAETHMENNQLPSVRPKRTIRKPKRYCDSNHLDIKDLSVSSDNEFYKIKRVLAQRPTAAGLEYLVQFAGEPAQNAIWIPDSGLNVKAKEYIKSKSIPFI